MPPDETDASPYSQNTLIGTACDVDFDDLLRILEPHRETVYTNGGSRGVSGIKAVRGREKEARVIIVDLAERHGFGLRLADDTTS
jgi:hypothetical protein